MPDPSKSLPGKEEMERSLQKLSKDLQETQRERDKALQQLARLKQHLLEKVFFFPLRIYLFIFLKDQRWLRVNLRDKYVQFILILSSLYIWHIYVCIYHSNIIYILENCMLWFLLYLTSLYPC